ncbi:AAA family ATPase [Vandammella animalimorsus]|uniref:AAA family ATPase n=1 Tax=Vandammella animalimorsus TaxID=2029117 RepID=A0A2A2T5N9_9BURK|nr:helix-turn-helix domain-containing protein [Vandammella animalimorsus]PAX16791.1 AAA family ATPase [Vandammella animalimorsus]PAX20411.1 AAA family ATPase [Vandammella animalimorsus]
MSTAIEQLLLQPEGKTLEFKRDLSSPRNALKTLVAFANSAGGRLVIGVDDARQVTGVIEPLDEEERICNLIADSIAPRLVPQVELASIDGRTVLVVEVFPSNSRPHYLKSLGPQQGVYVRLGSSSRQAGPELVAELGRAAQGVVFDELPMPELGPQDLDLQAAQRWFGPRRILDEKALTTLKLLRHEQGRLVPTQGAVLLFGKTRAQYFPDAWVQCGRFRGRDKVEIFDQTEIHEHLPDAMTAIELFLKKHAFKSAQFGAMRRKDVWSIPLGMLREAIVNALVHSDYSQRGTPIRVAFFDDRIDIESPGLLLPGMTVEDMKNGVSRIRNPVIARVFRELQLIEQWGSGVRRIFADAAEQGLPEPVITEIATGLRLSIYLREPMQVDRQSPESLGAQSEAQSEAQSDRVLQLLTAGPSSANALALGLGLKTKTGALKRTIKALVEQGLIAYTVPNKPDSRLQQYRLTEAGRKALARLTPAASLKDDHA